MSSFLAIAADLLVACLLVVTIVTSIRLSRKIAVMKADESAMRTTITELVVATEKADMAIGALRATVLESERTLSDRLGAAARHTERLAQEVSAGEAVIERVSRIAAISRRLRSEDGDEAPIAPPVRAALPEPMPAPLPVQVPEDSLRVAIRLARDVAGRSARRIGERAA